MIETNKELLKKLRKDAETLTLLELIENNPRINAHIVSNTWHSVNDNKIDYSDMSYGGTSSDD